MKLKIIKLGDSRLQQKSLPVNLPLNKEDQQLALSLLDYLVYAADPTNAEQPGVGIAAVQIGVLKRIFAVRVNLTQDEYFEEVLVNPTLIAKKGRAALAEGEGCLSVPMNQEGLVHRAAEIKIKGFSALKNAWVEYELAGYLAIVFQHEYDHLNGKLYFTRINHNQPLKTLKNELLI